VDFLSIDTEGSDLEILEAFDFGAHELRCISVEHNEHQRAALHTLLTATGTGASGPTFPDTTTGTSARTPTPTGRRPPSSAPWTRSAAAPASRMRSRSDGN
jgi:hypothetical protein